MRKIISLLILVITVTFGTKAFAMADNAKSACVINSLTGEVVFSKNENERRKMASTTKIMTAVIALEKSAEDEVVTVSGNASRQEGSSAYLKEGEQLPMQDILYGLMLNSGNDAAVAIAEHISGSEEKFAILMNEKAEVLGLQNTHFSNASGLDAEEHYTTAYELAMIAKYAMNMPKFREIVSAKTVAVQTDGSDKVLYFKNHNKMLDRYEGANGVKTGFTKASGRCLVSSAERDGMAFTAVTLDDPADWNDHKEMLDYAFSEYYPKKIVKEGEVIKNAVIGGTKYAMIAETNFVVPFKEHSGVSIEMITHIVSPLNAPINKDEKVGYIEIVYNGNVIGKVGIVSESDIYGESEIKMRNSFYKSFVCVVKKIFA